jgi:hypothetical protein
MTINIQAIEALFRKPQGETAEAVDFGPTIIGKFPFDSMRDFLGPDLVRAVDFVRADKRFGPVFGGDLSAYGGDHSRADLALCGEFARLGLNPGTIDTAMRCSELYRDKWERDDYRDRTIARALENNSPRAERPASFDRAESRWAGLLNPRNGEINISREDPPPRDWIVDGLLLAGKSVVLGGFGGVSKTQLALQLARSIALGVPFLGKRTKAGKVLAIFGEEDRSEIARRINADVRHRALGDGQIQQLIENIGAFGLVGEDARLTIQQKHGLDESGFHKAIIEAAATMGDVRLVIIDHLALVHGGDFNAREDAAQTMRLINAIAQETGAAVLVLAHTPKSASQAEHSDASMIAGSTAFVDQARGAWVLATMREQEARKFGVSEDDRKAHASLTVVKNNYGPTGDLFWFRRASRDGVGLLEEVELSVASTTANFAPKLEQALVGFVTKHRGQFSKTRLRDAYSGKKDGPFKASKGQIEATIEVMLHEGRLVIRPPTTDERARYGHGPRVTQVLDIPDDE